MAIIRQIPLIHPRILKKQGIEKTPVKHPAITTTTTTMGKTSMKKNFLILSVHLNSRKHGKLQTAVHWVRHISSEKLAMVSSRASTCSLTKLMAVLKVSWAWETSQVAVAWMVVTAQFTVALVVQTAVLTEVEMVLAVSVIMAEVWEVREFNWDVVVAMAELAALSMLLVACVTSWFIWLVSQLTESAAEVTASEVESAASEAVSVTVLTAEEAASEMASVRSPNPKQVACRTSARMRSSLIMKIIIANSLLKQTNQGLDYPLDWISIKHHDYRSDDHV